VTLPQRKYVDGHGLLTLAGCADLLSVLRREPRRYPCLLESAAHGTAHARFDILFAFPEYTISLFGDGRLERDDRPEPAGDFLALLDRLWRDAQAPVAPALADLPFTGGWFVYLGYELVREIEPKLRCAPVDPQLPVARLIRVPAAMIVDHAMGCTHLVCEPQRYEELVPEMRSDLVVATDSLPGRVELARLCEESAGIYVEAVKRALAYIRAGDVFQVNLSRTWHAELRAPVEAGALYERLRRSNPAPFAGLLMLDADTALVSSSPERLVRVVDGQVITRPIAGTFPRSQDRAQDERWSRALQAHPKERAEHVMLIDLERNDLGRVAQTGTVKVDELMVLESYAHVHHLVSQVSARLRPGTTPAQVIRAVFPGGTITGCPKVRCMEIIAELEGAARGAYTGSMGYINRDGSMDLNILIRTMVLAGNQAWLRAGAGIVADSRPLRELYETRAKARGMLRALGSA
jgi:anthranilate synthase component 1